MQCSHDNTPWYRDATPSDDVTDIDVVTRPTRPPIGSSLSAARSACEGRCGAPSDLQVRTRLND